MSTITHSDPQYGIPYRMKVTHTPNPSGQYSASLQAVNPITGHLLKYSQMDARLRTKSKHPDTTVMVCAQGASESEAEAAAKEKMRSLYILTVAYYRTVLCHTPEVFSDSFTAFYALYQEEYRATLSGNSATVRGKESLLCTYILPALERIKLHDMTDKQYTDTLHKITRKRSLSASRRQQLAHLYHDFVLFAYEKGCCAYPPPDTDTDVTPAQKASRAASAGARQICLNDNARAQLLAGIDGDPGSATSLTINLIYEGLNYEDITLCRFCDLTAIKEGGIPIFTLSIPDSGHDTQPVSRVRRVPLSYETSRSIMQRYLYWQEQLHATHEEILAKPLVSSRRNHAAAYSAEKLRALVRDAMQKHMKISPKTSKGEIDINLLMRDAAYRIQNQIGADTEQANAVLGRAQSTVDGRHYYDLYCPANMLVMSAKMDRAPLRLPAEPSPNAAPYQVTPPQMLPIYVSGHATHTLSLDLAAKSTVSIRLNKAARCTVHISSPSHHFQNSGGQNYDAP